MSRYNALFSISCRFWDFLRVRQSYVGDFVIGGTELKIAETYAVARNCIVNHAIVVGSLFDPGDYEGRATVHSLVKLKDANPAAAYHIERPYAN